MEAVPGTPSSDIFNAITNGKVLQINTLLNQADILRFRSKDGKTPLIFAVCDAKEDTRTHLVRMFLRHGCDVNACDEIGRTALIYSCMEHDKIDLVRLIARNKKCDPNVQDIEGYTAVMYAILSSNASALRVIVNTKSTKEVLNLKLRNSQGLSALDLCIKLQMPECCKVLVTDGGVTVKKAKHQREVMRLLEQENCYIGSNTPTGMGPSRNTSVTGFRKVESPIPENELLRGYRPFRDVTPHADEYDERGTPLTRSNSLYRSNSNLNSRRLEADQGRPASFSTPNEIFGLLNSQRNVKRALTPISRNSPRRHLTTPDDQSFSTQVRLPSIPSGRKLYLVSSPNSFPSPEYR